MDLRMSMGRGGSDITRNYIILERQLILPFFPRQILPLEHLDLFLSLAYHQEHDLEKKKFNKK